MNQVYATGSIVPEPPEDMSWTANLRWLVSVMNDDDRSLGFIAGCLSYCVVNDGITAKQERGCRKVLDRVLDDFENLQLDCQARADEPV